MHVAQPAKVPAYAGPHSDAVARARELLTTRGRKAAGRFSFEGPTLLEEARRTGIEVEELFATPRALERNALIASYENDGTVVYEIDDRTLAKISDLETPTGLVAIARSRRHAAPDVLRTGRTLVLADVSDPGNAGTLLRSADAFGATGVVFGADGVDPYHPKVVRGAMGSLFRASLAVCGAREFADAADETGIAVIGLESGAEAIDTGVFRAPFAIVVGHERRGLGIWRAACTRFASIPMTGEAESLNAAVAGSIALYESRRGDTR